MSLPKTNGSPGGPPATSSLILRLYIAHGARTSIAAVANLKGAVADCQGEAAEVEIIDVYKAPKRALADRILVTPTLLRIRPDNVAIMIGDLADRQMLAQFIEG